MATSIKSVPKKPNGSKAADRKVYAAAVLSGIYAAVGEKILNLENHEYEAAQKNARKVALDQADEMVRQSA